MAGGGSRDLFLGIVAIAAVLVGVYMVDPTFGGLLPGRDGFTGTLSSASNGSQPPDFPGGSGEANRAAVMSNPNAALSGYEGPASFGNAETPEGCYPRDQLMPSELLPKDQNSV